ncbi:MAG: LysR substrate-binding domain-containing protein [Candidatus Binataceae bacterium]
MAVLSVDHPLAGRPSATLGELRDTPFILFESGFALNRIILDACSRQGFEPSIVARSSQIDFIAELGGAGLGVAFLPQTIAQQRGHAPVTSRAPNGTWPWPGDAVPISRPPRRRGSPWCARFIPAVSSRTS